MDIYILKFISNENPNIWYDNIIAFLEFENASLYKKELEYRSKELSEKIKIIRDELGVIIHELNIKWVSKHEDKEKKGYMKKYQKHYLPLGKYNIEYQNKKRKLIEEWQEENNSEYWIDYRDSSEYHRDKFEIEKLCLK